MAEVMKAPSEAPKHLPTEQGRTSENLNSIVQELRKGNASPERKQHAVDYVIRFSQIESKYQSLRADVRNDVRRFIELALGDRLNTHLAEYNVSRFDTDGQKGFDERESKNFTDSIGESLTQIVILGGLEKFSRIHERSDSKKGFANADKYLADSINLKSYVYEKGSQKNFTDMLLQRASHISESEYARIQENPFHPTSPESWKELGILLAKEFGSGVEDVLKFLTNIPSGIILVPRYLSCRAGTYGDHEAERIESEILLKELVEENPSLGILEMLGEKGLEMLKRMAEMFSSGKQGDIALLMITIAGLVAGGAGAAKLGLNFTRKVMVKRARSAGYKARKAGETTSRATRNSLKKVSTAVGVVSVHAQRADDIASGAGMGHLQGSFDNASHMEKPKRTTGGHSELPIEEKMERAEKRSGISREEVIRNSELSPEKRKLKAQELYDRYIGEGRLEADTHLTEPKWEVILDIHENVSKGIYKNNQEDINRMVRHLDANGIGKKERDLLFRNGILGSNADPAFIRIAEDKGISGPKIVHDPKGPNAAKAEARIAHPEIDVPEIRGKLANQEYFPSELEKLRTELGPDNMRVLQKEYEDALVRSIELRYRDHGDNSFLSDINSSHLRGRFGDDICDRAISYRIKAKKNMKIGKDIDSSTAKEYEALRTGSALPQQDKLRMLHEVRSHLLEYDDPTDARKKLKDISRGRGQAICNDLIQDIEQKILSDAPLAKEDFRLFRIIEDALPDQKRVRFYKKLFESAPDDIFKGYRDEMIQAFERMGQSSGFENEFKTLGLSAEKRRRWYEILVGNDKEYELIQSLDRKAYSLTDLSETQAQQVKTQVLAYRQSNGLTRIRDNVIGLFR